MTTEEILLQTIASLTKTNEEQSRQLAAQGNQIAELTAELKKMAVQIAWFQRQMYGRKSERNIAVNNQPGLFDDMETETPVVTDEVQEPAEETLTYTRKKGQEGTSRVRETWEDLPVLEIRTIEPKGVDLARYRRMGEQIPILSAPSPGSASASRLCVPNTDSSTRQSRWNAARVCS